MTFVRALIQTMPTARTRLRSSRPADAICQLRFAGTRFAVALVPRFRHFWQTSARAKRVWSFVPGRTLRGRRLVRGAEIEWRGRVALDALITLRAYGRL